MVSRGTRTARRAGGAGSPQRGAVYVCERGMCAPLSRRHSGRELGMPLNYCTRYHPPKKQKAFRLWIAPRSRRDPRAVLAPVLGARRREHAGSASHRDGVPPLAPRALRAVHELGRYLPQSRHGMSMGCRAGQAAALAAGSARPTRRAAPGGAASSAPSAEGPPRPRARGAGRAGARGALARRAGSSPAHPPQPAGTRRARHGRGEGARQREQTHRPGKPMPRLGQHGGGRGFDRAASHLGLTQLFSSFSATASGPATRRATRELGSWECVGA